MNYILRTILFTIMLFLSLYSYPQFVPQDTSHQTPGTDSTGIKFLHIPEDAMFIPAYYLYNHNWNTESVKAHKYDHWLKEDTCMIIFPKDTGRYFVCPYPGKVISPFGLRGRKIHTGTDIKLKLNDTVRCAFHGMVRLARWYYGYGYTVVVRHYNGLETLYGHLNKMLVKPDQMVKAGDVIGLGGRTGRASCTHLHFETRFLEDAFNAETVIDFNDCCLRSDTLIITSSTFSRSRYFSGKVKKSPNVTSQKEKNNNVKGLTSEENKNTAALQPGKDGALYYTIKSGDTLYGIAKKYGTTVDHICKVSNINRNSILRLGQRIRIR